MLKNLRIPALVFLFLLAPRLWILLNSSYTFYSDDAIYAILARSWLEGKWQYVFHPTWPPLYPALSAAVGLVITSFENALRITSLIFGTALIIPLFFLLKRTLSLAQAISFCVALSLFIPLLTMSLLPLSDSLAVFLVVSGLVAVYFSFPFGGQPKQRLLLLASFFFGLVYLTRTEGTMFFFLTLIYLVICMLRFRTRGYLLTVLLFVVVFILTISPYVVASRVQIGEWSLSPKFSAQIQQGHSFALNKRGTTWAQEVTSPKNPDFASPYFRNGTGYLLERLNIFLRLYPEKQEKWQSVFLSAFSVWAIPFIIVGLGSLLKTRFKWSVLYLVFILFAAVPVTIFSTPVHDIRYLAWVIPFLLYFFYAGINAVARKKTIAAVLSFGIVLTFPGVNLDNLIDPKAVAENFSRTSNKSELRDAGVWIKENTSNRIPRIMMRHEGVEFYSGGETVYMPQVGYDELLGYAKKQDVDYIIAWGEELAGDKELVFLLDGNLGHHGVEKVYTIEGRSKLYVYTLTDD